MSDEEKNKEGIVQDQPSSVSNGVMQQKQSAEGIGTLLEDMAKEFTKAAIESVQSWGKIGKAANDLFPTPQPQSDSEKLAQFAADIKKHQESMNPASFGSIPPGMSTELILGSSRPVISEAMPQLWESEEMQQQQKAEGIGTLLEGMAKEFTKAAVESVQSWAKIGKAANDLFPAPQPQNDSEKLAQFVADIKRHQESMNPASFGSIPHGMSTELILGSSRPVISEAMPQLWENTQPNMAAYKPLDMTDLMKRYFETSLLMSPVMSATATMVTQYLAPAIKEVATRIAGNQTVQDMGNAAAKKAQEAKEAITSRIPSSVSTMTNDLVDAMATNIMSVIPANVVDSLREQPEPLFATPQLREDIPAAPKISEVTLKPLTADHIASFTQTPTVNLAASFPDAQIDALKKKPQVVSAIRSEVATQLDLNSEKTPSIDRTESWEITPEADKIKEEIELDSKRPLTAKEVNGMAPEKMEALTDKDYLKNLPHSEIPSFTNGTFRRVFEKDLNLTPKQIQAINVKKQLTGLKVPNNVQQHFTEKQQQEHQEAGQSKSAVRSNARS